MRTLTIFHDPRCGMCSKFSLWLTAQPRWVEVEFFDWASDDATRRLPGIREMYAGKDVVVLADDGAWWQGDAAWLTCLWATREYRPWSYRLASPALRPSGFAYGESADAVPPAPPLGGRRSGRSD